MLALAQPKAPRHARHEEYLHLILGYLHLLASSWQSRNRGRDVHNPVAWTGLEAADKQTVSWMLYQAHVEQFRRVLSCHAGYERVESALLVDNGSFALTPDGEVFADAFLAGVFAAVPADCPLPVLQLGSLVPNYDGSTRTFNWGRNILKSYRQPSDNQEMVLCAAEELDWPAWFDDPLPSQAGRRSKVRLHDTIKALNRHQHPYLVHFRGDGTGTRAGWILR
jgi:hypothetical protein